MRPHQAKLCESLNQAMTIETNSMVNAGGIVDPLADFARSAVQTLARDPKSLEYLFLSDAWVLDPKERER